MAHLAASAILGPWANFAVMIGGAAAGLTGLMFVVITLVSGERVRRNPDGISTFSTPTVVHFAATLFVAAALLAPWHWLIYPAYLLGLLGLFGIGYVVRLMNKQRHLRSGYTPDLEDQTWYLAVPMVAYALILAGALLLFRIPGEGLFAVGAGSVWLIFAGIHNAWDIVTYIATGAIDEDP